MLNIILNLEWKLYFLISGLKTYNKNPIYIDWMLLKNIDI